MSYNGVGLSTARGSGTNGYVQKNLSSIKHKTVIRKDISNYLNAPEHQIKAANQDILDHDRKRLIEIKCLELEDSLLLEGLTEQDIDTRVDDLRQRLLNDLTVNIEKQLKIKDYQTHQRAEAKERDNKRFGEGNLWYTIYNSIGDQD